MKEDEKEETPEETAERQRVNAELARWFGID